MTLYQTIQQRLEPLNPSVLRLVDDSDKHRGHAGNTGGAHLELHIASAQFEGLKTIACHRLVYQYLADLIPGTIHALSIKIIKVEL